MKGGPADRLGVDRRHVTLPPGMGVDTIPFTHLGDRCTTLSSGTLNRAITAVRSSRTLAEHLAAATLRRGAHLAFTMAVETCTAQVPG